MKDVISTIEEAALKRNILRIVYQDKKGNVTERMTEPYEIKDNAYYGFCLKKNSIRKFDLNGIREAEVIPQTFHPRWEIKI